MREAVWSVDRDQAVSNLRTMDDIFEAELLSRNTQLTLVGAFALLALVMAAIGLYGVLAYSVAQRLPEIGIRVALGAARATVVVETLRNAMVLAAAGIVLGLGLAVAVSRALQSSLFGVEPLDVSTLAGTAVLLCADGAPCERGSRGSRRERRPLPRLARRVRARSPEARSLKPEASSVSRR